MKYSTAEMLYQPRPPYQRIPWGTQSGNNVFRPLVAPIPFKHHVPPEPTIATPDPSASAQDKPNSNIKPAAQCKASRCPYGRFHAPLRGDSTMLEGVLSQTAEINPNRVASPVPFS